MLLPGLMSGGSGFELPAPSEYDWSAVVSRPIPSAPATKVQATSRQRVSCPAVQTRRLRRTLRLCRKKKQGCSTRRTTSVIASSQEQDRFSIRFPAAVSQRVSCSTHIAERKAVSALKELTPVAPLYYHSLDA